MPFSPLVWNNVTLGPLVLVWLIYFELKIILLKLLFMDFIAVKETWAENFRQARQWQLPHYLFLPLHFYHLVSTQIWPDIIKPDFPPVAPSSASLHAPPPLSLSLSLPHGNRRCFMLCTIRTIQHQAGQALPACAQSNHSLMNTFGAVCSKLLPVGARATGNQPPPFPSSSPPSQQFPSPPVPTYWYLL